MPVRQTAFLKPRSRDRTGKARHRGGGPSSKRELKLRKIRLFRNSWSLYNLEESWRLPA